MLKILIFLTTFSVTLAYFKPLPVPGFMPDFGGKINRGIKGIGNKNINYQQISMPLDHFNILDNRTFNMSYYTYDEYFIPGGPIFLGVGGNEWELIISHMWEIGSQVGAYLISVHQRFTESSLPSQIFDMDTLRFLTIEQKIEDIVRLVAYLKQQDSFSQSKVIMFGCSLDASLGTWMRLKYPHLIHGVIASSAPLEVKADFYEYYEAISDLIADWQNPQCRDNVHEGFKEMMVVVERNDTQRFSEVFRLCSPHSLEELEVSTFVTQISGLLDYLITIDPFCAYLNEYPGTPFEKIGAFVGLFIPAEDCLKPFTFDEIVYFLRPDGTLLNDRQLYYTFCTQVGLFLSSPTNDSLLAGALKLSHFTENLCPRVFQESISGDNIMAGINQTLQTYGGKRPEVTNVVSVHGEKCPIRHIGIVEDLNPESPAIVIGNAATCSDFNVSKPTDSPQLVEARRRIKAIIESWLE